METNDGHNNLKASAIFNDIRLGKDTTYLIEKHILHNPPFFFKDQMDVFFDIKKKISQKYNIPVTNIYLVGSGQLGFSLNPANQFSDFRFNDEGDKKASDLDFAIISSKLFNDIWDTLCVFRLSDVPHEDKQWQEFRDFKNYLFKGWIRPDKFPFDFTLRKEWFKFFESLNPLVNRKVTCGLFRNETSFINQYTRSLNELINLVNTGAI